MIPTAKPTEKEGSAGGEGWEWILLAHHHFAMCMRDVAFDAAIIDHVGQDTLCLIQIHVLHTHPLQCTQEQGDVDLVCATHQEPVGERGTLYIILRSTG